MKGEGLTPEQRIERGRRASEMLRDEVLLEAFDAAKAQFVEEWLASPETERQRAAWAKYHAVDAVQDDLRRIVADGQIAAQPPRKRL